MYQEYYLPPSYLPQSFFEQEDYDFYGNCAKLSKSQIEHMKEHLEELVKQLYSKEPLNVDFLETSIEEICHLLHVEMPRTDPMISRCVI